jgi:hypothetical protein
VVESDAVADGDIHSRNVAFIGGDHTIYADLGLLGPLLKAFPEEFHRNVIAMGCKGDASIRQVAKDFGI